MDVTGATTLGSTVELLADAATVTHSGTTSLSISSTNGYVAVESVQFAGDNIGISADTDLMVLTSGTLTVDGKVASTTLDVTGAVTYGSTLDVAGATNLAGTLDVTGATTLGSTVELLADAATVTHSGTTSLSILSTGGYVAVESVQFAGIQHRHQRGHEPDGIDVGDVGRLTEGGVDDAGVDGAVTYGSTLDVAGATNLTSTLDVTGATTLGSTVELLADAATVTPGRTTSLSISSTGGYVAVESVQFAGDNIGISGDTNLMVLTSGTLTVDGKVASTTLDVTGAVTYGSTLDVAGATNLTSTLDVTGATTLGSTVELLAGRSDGHAQQDDVSVDIEH